MSVCQRIRYIISFPSFPRKRKRKTDADVNYNHDAGRIPILLPPSIPRPLTRVPILHRRDPTVDAVD